MKTFLQIAAALMVVAQALDLAPSIQLKRCFPMQTFIMYDCSLSETQKLEKISALSLKAYDGIIVPHQNCQMVAEYY